MNFDLSENFDKIWNFINSQDAMQSILGGPLIELKFILIKKKKGGTLIRAASDLFVSSFSSFDKIY